MGRLLPALLIGLSGCASFPETVSKLPDADYRTELADTPFYPQEQYQCGPAALATVLQASGVDVSPDDLVSKVYLPGRQGSLQTELLAATRSAGRIPYIVNGSLAAIAEELDDGRPVLVLQNLGVSIMPRWHYAVVIGIDGNNNSVLLRSGTDKRRRTSIDVFLRTWARSDFWAFSALQPGQIPTNVDRVAYLAAVADLEEVGMLEEAVVSWRAALQKWPDDPIAQFGLGNTLLALGRAGEAEQIYRDMLATNPDLAIARNNLALALQQQVRLDEALLEIDRAIQQTDDTRLLDELYDTRDTLQRAQQELAR